MRNTKVARIAIVIALILATLANSACNDDKLKAIATNVDRLALLIADGREVRDELLETGIIDTGEAKAITLGLIKVNAALKAFNARAKTYADAGGLTPEGKIELKKLASDIAGAASELVNNGTFGVKNPDAQIRVNAAIGAIKQITLTIVDTVSLIKTKGAK